MFIHKSTAVWVLQEGERVSSNRLFRVRTKQPFSTEKQHKTETKSLEHPSACPTVGIGEVCAFRYNHSWRIGKVLKFSFFKEKTKGSQQYRGIVANVDDLRIGVLCTWFTSTTVAPNRLFMSNDVNHEYISLARYYLCTL